MSKIPYFTEHSSFVRLLIKQRREEDATPGKAPIEQEAVSEKTVASQQ